jgi:thiamine monophosphate synthase
VKQVRESGAEGVAIVSAVLTASNIGEAVREFLKHLS